MLSQSMDSPRATATVLTAPGVGAVAVIEVAFDDPNKANSVFHAFFAGPSRTLATTSVGRIVYGRWSGEDVILVRTAESRWEIHCHGGAIAVDRILADLRDANVGVDKRRQQTGIEESGAVRVAVLQTLQQCRTSKTAGLALAQLDGRLQRLLDNAQSDIEALRDSARQHIQRWKNLADHLARPWRVAIVGSPNVGKSSLLNALAGLDRSIVSSTPGTTRDLVEVNIVVDGWTFQLVDTAGVRDSAVSPLERIGIEQSLISLQNCDLVCVVIDVTDRQLQPSLLKPLCQLKVPVSILYNKSDLKHDDGTSFLAPDLKDMPITELKVAAVFSVSALTGAGLPEFLQWLVRTLIPEEPDAETALPIQWM